MANYALINPGKFHLGDPHDFPPRQNRRFDERNHISEIKWKTFVILNKRVYIGNVKLVQSDGTERVLSDSMFKSKSNKYDSFTLDRRIDVAVADGEEIIRLATFADRILQYKQNTLHIINATKSQEFLEEALTSQREKDFKSRVVPSGVLGLQDEIDRAAEQAKQAQKDVLKGELTKLKSLPEGIGVAPPSFVSEDVPKDFETIERSLPGDFESLKEEREPSITDKKSETLSLTNVKISLFFKIY